MDKDIRAQLFAQLQGVLNQIGATTTMIKGADFQNGDTLRMLTPLNEQGGTALIEFSLIDVDSDVSIMQIYTTVLTELTGGTNELEKAVARLNLTCPIGAYGIFYAGLQCYHKYCVIIEADAQMDGSVDALMRALQFIIQTVAADYPLLYALGSGALTFDKAVEDGYIKL